MERRRRACKNCHVLKVRCKPSEDGAEACDRCQRGGKECVPAMRRLQRDRIAALEAQVQELSNALEAQSLNQSCVDGDARKTRKLSENVYSDSGSERSPLQIASTDLAYIDERVSQEVQKRVVDVYNRQHSHYLPLLHAEPLDLDSLRTRIPILLLAILAFPTSGVLNMEIQLELVGRAMQEFASRLIAAGERSLELTQALLIASYWFRARPGHKHATILQIVQLSTSMAINLGIAGSDAPHDPGTWFERSDQALSLEGCRTWLSCFLTGSAMTTVMRRPDGNPWTRHHDISLAYVQAHACTLPQRTFCSVIQGELLCYHAVTRLDLCNTSIPSIFASNQVKNKVSQLREDIEVWTHGLSPDLCRPELLIYRHQALIYLNEPVLHTDSNKGSFSAPYVAERIAAADFAHPVVTVDHVAALYALKDSCQTVIELASNLDANIVSSTSPLFYTPRVLYALMVLAKLYVAVTAPGNTYGAVLSRQELGLPYYFAGMKRLAKSLTTVDSTSFTAMIIGAYSGIEDWYKSYTAIVEQYERGTASSMADSVVYLEPLEPKARITSSDTDLKVPTDDLWFQQDVFDGHALYP